MCYIINLFLERVITTRLESSYENEKKKKNDSFNLNAETDAKKVWKKKKKKQQTAREEGRKEEEGEEGGAYPLPSPHHCLYLLVFTRFLATSLFNRMIRKSSYLACIIYPGHSY